MLRPRNRVVRQGGLRRRGGVHSVTKSGARQGDRQQTFAELDEYFATDDTGDEDHSLRNQKRRRGWPSS